MPIRLQKNNNDSKDIQYNTYVSELFELVFNALRFKIFLI